MGKAKDVLLTTGMRRKEAERIEDELRKAGVLVEEEEQEHVEVKKRVRGKTTTKNVSEVKADYSI